MKVNERSQSSSGNGSVRGVQPDSVTLKAEKAAHRAFLIRKGWDQSVRDGGRLTGWVGYLAGGLAATVDGDKHGVGEDPETFDTLTGVGFAITAIPGNIIGCVLSPIRMVHLCTNRKVMYTSTQIEAACTAWGGFDPVRVRSAATEVVQNYGSYSWLRGSNSTHELMNQLKTELQNTDTGDVKLRELIKDYLQKKEEPLTGHLRKLRCVIVSDAYYINQGKRMFNIIMEVLLRGINTTQEGEPSE